MTGEAVRMLLVVIISWVHLPKLAVAYTLDDFFSNLSNSALTSFTVPTGTQLKINRGVPVISRNVTIACARPSGCQLSTIGSLDTFRADSCRVKKVIRIFLKNFASTTLISGTIRYGYSWENPVVGGTHIFFKCRDGCANRSCGAGTCISGAVPLSFSCKCNSNAYKDSTTKTCTVCPKTKNCCNKISCGLGTCFMNANPWKPQCRCNRGTIMNAQGLCRTPEQALRDNLLDPTVTRIELLQNLKLTAALPAVNRSLTILGAGSRQVSIDGAGRFPIFEFYCPPINNFFPSNSKFQNPDFQAHNFLLTNAKGAAINHYCGTLIISNSSLRNNSPHAIKSLTTLTIKDSSVVENTSPTGAVLSQGGYFSNVRFAKNIGIAVAIVKQPFSGYFSIAFHNCSFIENKANGYGAAVHLEGLYWTTDENWSINADFYGCRFIGNIASGWGGAISGDHAFVRIRNSLFLNNVAHSGGAIWGIVKGDYPVKVSTIRVKNCTFVNNTATSIKGGGAIKASLGLDVCESTFLGNKDKAGTPSNINSIDNDPLKYFAFSVVRGCPTVPPYVDYCDVQDVDPTCYGDIDLLLQNGTCSRCNF